MVHVTTGIVVRESAGTTQVKPQRLVESWNAKTERDTVSRPCSAPENKAFLPVDRQIRQHTDSVTMASPSRNDLVTIGRYPRTGRPNSSTQNRGSTLNALFSAATQHHLSYAAYMVRLWQDTPDGPWRASAQSVHSGEVKRFGTLQDLFAFFLTESRNTVCPSNEE